MKKYDYLIVGAGLYGAVMAYELGKKGKKCLVIDRRDHIAGIFIVKRSKESMFINMELIFFIHQIKRYGSI